MSQKYYQKLWQDTQEDVKKILATDRKVNKKGPFKDSNTAKWLIGHLYMGYVRIINRLDECYDQMIHPQKREVICRLLDLSLGRLLELKSEIVRIENDDYVFFDNVLMELKLTHDDVEIHVPKYYWRTRREQAQHRAELMRQVYDEFERQRFKEDYLKNFPIEERDKEWEKYLLEEQKKEKHKAELQQRIMLTEKLEKKQVKPTKEKVVRDARDRRVSEIVKEDILQDITPEMGKEIMHHGLLKSLMGRQKNRPRDKYAWEKLPPEDTEAAATVIQRHWRRHWKRVQAALGKQILLKLWGMVRHGSRNTAMYQKLKEVAEIFRAVQEKNQQEYEDAMAKIKDRVTAFYAVPIEEDTVDEIVGWFQYYVDESGYLPDYPPAKEVVPKGDIMGVPKKLGPDFMERLNQQRNVRKLSGAGQKLTALGISLAGWLPIGGSALVTAGHWIDAKEYLRCQMELEKMKNMANKEGAAEKKKKEEQKKKQNELKKLLAEEGEAFQLKPSNYRVGLAKADRDYRVTWMDRDETNNPHQRYIYDFIKEDKIWELSMEVRKEVDKMMALELEVLKDALERDKNPKKKRRKKKKKAGRKRKGRKQKKDPTGDRSIDDLFLELFRNGIIKDYERAYLSEFHGERSYAAFDLRQKLIDWPPSAGDIRELILQLCIIPLGSARVHQLSPIIRSVCLIGPENTGKEFLARIICSETAAVMFDLTPSNVAGKYPGKEGLKMLQHLVQKMSRVLQPSVIFVDGAEKTFYRKVPKEEKPLEPKRLARMITKVVKEIKPEDQVLVLGVSSRPWMARKKKLLKAYNKIIYIPPMDYASYMWLWDVLLRPYGSVPEEFDVSCLAKVSDGFAVKDIIQTVKSILTGRRISESNKAPFTQVEFLNELLKYKPADKKLRQKCLKFYSGLELPKKRAKKLAEAQGELEKAQRKK